MPATPVKMMRLAEVEATVGLKRSAIYDHISRGTFPKPLRVGPRLVAWRSDELAAWQDSLKYHHEQPAA